MLRVITFLILLVPATKAHSEAYYLIPEAVEQAEHLGSEAKQLGNKTFRTPHSAHEAMRRLHVIDHDLEKIVHVGSRFQKTIILLEQGIADAANLAEQDRQLVYEWEPILKGNYRLIKISAADAERTDIRTLTAMTMLEGMISNLGNHQHSHRQYQRIELKFTQEAIAINKARERLHDQLVRIRYELTRIHQIAEKKQ